jgi:hypothetical protein
MARRIYPLELILRPHGTAELINAREQILWASDGDEEFKDEFNDEFLDEDDFDDILDYLRDAELILPEEYDKFDTGEFEMTIESLEDSVNSGPEDDEDEEDDEE